MASHRQAFCTGLVSRQLPMCWSHPWSNPPFALLGLAAAHQGITEWRRHNTLPILTLSFSFKELMYCFSLPPPSLINDSHRLFDVEKEGGCLKNKKP